MSNAASTPTELESPYAPFYPFFRKLAVGAVVCALLVPVVLHFLKGSHIHTHEDFVRNDLRSLGSMLQSYQHLNGTFPSAAQGLEALVNKPAGEPQPAKWQQLRSELPVDRWGNGYVYELPGRRSGKGYDVYSKGKDRIAHTEDDIGNWSSD